jgi:hypothetical protein
MTRNVTYIEDIHFFDKVVEEGPEISIKFTVLAGVGSRVSST